MSDIEAADRIAVALDTPERGQLDAWVRALGPHAGCLKVGLEAFVRWGPPMVEATRSHARSLFLDLKLHDIPATVAGAVRSAVDLGVDYLTVHAGGGPAMLEAAAEAAAAAGGRTTILAVTVLTHLDAGELSALGLPGAAAERVSAWAALAERAGCGGVVCSPLEVGRLRRELPPPFRLVTPGIRLADGQGSALGDQKRVATPRQAVADGSDLLVIGRPITRSDDPVAALERIAAEIS
jgi:orotidine-5'-phosphate decarboxylase